MQRNANLVDLENPEKMRLLSLSEVSIQPITSPPKFLKNREVRMGVSGDMQPALRGHRWAGPVQAGMAEVGLGRLAEFCRIWQNLAEFGRIWPNLANFRWSVLGSIDSYDSENRGICSVFFSRSTILAHFCTAPSVIFLII